jgi:predicted histidine transporter YuiF (NhaC family)
MAVHASVSSPGSLVQLIRGNQAGTFLLQWFHRILLQMAMVVEFGSSTRTIAILKNIFVPFGILFSLGLVDMKQMVEIGVERALVDRAGLRCG